MSYMVPFMLDAQSVYIVSLEIAMRLFSVAFFAQMILSLL